MQASNNKNNNLRHAMMMAGVLGGVGAVLLYKLFAESPRSLERRLRRKKPIDEKDKSKKEVRIWIDGCFDLMHFGHANAFRQAKALGDYLIVGLNPDVEIKKYKGPPIMNDEERFIAVSACRFVDEVIPNVPYVLDREYLNMVFEKYGVDYVVHGDDPCLLPDGSDVYEEAKKAGRFKTISRTEGVSTTEIVGRMLLMTRSHHDYTRGSVYDDDCLSIASEIHLPFIRQSDFLPTSRRIKDFGSGKRPQKDDKVVYIDGSWDMFHAGHIEVLEKARQLGDFLLVGVHPDDAINRILESNYPILNLHERVLSVMSCRHVDEVIFGAPYGITQELLTTFNISTVITGDLYTGGPDDPYEIPRKLGILRTVEKTRDLSTEEIVDRIIKQKLAFEKRQKVKATKEDTYKKNREYVEEV